MSVALLSVGLGSLGGARRADTALIAGWGMTGLGTLVIGTLTTAPLSLALIAAALLGGAGLARIAVHAARNHLVLETEGFGRVLLLALPLLALIASLNPANWDDFSHWLLNARYLTIVGHFPTLAQPNFGSGHAGYPYGMALPTYGVALLTGQWSTAAGIYWSAIVLLAACAALAVTLEEQITRAGQPATRRSAWLAAALALLFGVMLSPAFTPKFALSNTADGTTGAVLAILCRQLLIVLQPGRSARRWPDKVALAFVCIGFVNLRQTNLVLLGLCFGSFALLIAVTRRRIAAADHAPLLGPLIATGAAWYLWHRYAQAQIPGGQFVLLSAWRWPMLGAILAAVGRTMIVKGGFFIC